MKSSSDVSEAGAWDFLSFPLSDIFLNEIVPKFLTLRDFLNLGAVSKRYREVLGPKTVLGNRIVGKITLHSARHYTAGGDLLYTEQLPTIGQSSVEESLAENAILIAQLRQSALQRRSIITFPASSGENLSVQHRTQRIISQHRPKSWEDIQTVRSKYRGIVPTSPPESRFVVVNLSGVNIYIHFIAQDGLVLVRDGDCVPPHRDQNQSQPESFIVRGTETPHHVFYHHSTLYHSFAICFNEGGPPFAIYQQRRGYLRSRRNAWLDGLHAHAIAVLPGARVQELYCDVMRNIQTRIAAVYFRCRFTGNILPGIGVEARNTGRNNPQDSDSATETTKEYYGLGVPSVGNPDRQRPLSREMWRRVCESFHPAGRDTSIPLVRSVNPFGEAMYREWILNTGPAATTVQQDP